MSAQDTRNLLVELVCEELPPKALKKLGEAFAGVLGTSLKSQGLAAPEATVSAFASPRRLAFCIQGHADGHQLERHRLVVGPRPHGADVRGQPPR